MGTQKTNPPILNLQVSPTLGLSCKRLTLGQPCEGLSPQLFEALALSGKMAPADFYGMRYFNSVNVGAFRTKKALNPVNYLSGLIQRNIFNKSAEAACPEFTGQGFTLAQVQKFLREYSQKAFDS